MDASSQRILIAGSTGYLGNHLVKALLGSGSDVKALARNKAGLAGLGLNEYQIKIAQATDAATLKGCCDGIDVVISTIGITRQKDGLSYMGVDYQANLNLLREAERAEVKKFIYMSAFNAGEFQATRMLAAKERFARELLASSQLLPCVIRPTGFYVDIEELYRMASSGRVYLFGDGEVKLNPIHGSDLARFCLAAIEQEESELDVGGAEIFSVNEIAELAFAAQNKPIRISYLPDWLRVVALKICSLLPERWGGAPEFFLTAMAQDMVAPTYGEQSLEKYFETLH